jgi:hypothetical protein
MSVTSDQQCNLSSLYIYIRSLLRIDVDIVAMISSSHGCNDTRFDSSRVVGEAGPGYLLLGSSLIDY